MCGGMAEVKSHLVKRSRSKGHREGLLKPGQNCVHLLLHLLGEIPMLLCRNKMDKKQSIVKMTKVGNTWFGSLWIYLISTQLRLLGLKHEVLILVSLLALLLSSSCCNILIEK